MANAPVAYDLTHLVSRLMSRKPSGIDQIDLAYARHFLAPGRAPLASGVKYGLSAGRVLDNAAANSALAAADRTWRVAKSAASAGTPGSRLAAHVAHLRHRAARTRGATIPEGAVYLNVAQHLLEWPFLLRWLDRRPDLRKVFFLHDLLPLDYPEYFRATNVRAFGKRIATALHHADAFIVSTEAVRDRLVREIGRHGLAPRPILAAPFGSRLADVAEAPGEPSVADPYFLMVGTIEPRKNHLMILHVWRDIAERMGPKAPRLAIVGARGWHYGQVADLLDRGGPWRGLVHETGAISDAALKSLMRGARALLAPSIDEGFGLPIVEALEAGTPVIAAGNAAAREVSRGHAKLLSPIDGAAWRSSVLDLLDADGPASAEAKRLARGYVAPTWKDHFASVEDFIAGL